MITVSFPTGLNIEYPTANDYRSVSSVCGVPRIEIRHTEKDQVDRVLALVQARDVVLTYGKLPKAGSG